MRSGQWMWRVSTFSLPAAQLHTSASIITHGNSDLMEAQTIEENACSALFSLAFLKAAPYNMVIPEEKENGRVAFPPLWKDVFCILVTHMG